MIRVNFQTESHFPVKTKIIKEAVKSYLKKKVNRTAEVNVSIIGNRLMKNLNRKYRKIDSTTTVLSFSQIEKSDNDNEVFVSSPDRILRLGDVVVSFPEAVRLARETNKMVDETVIELVFHGIDHLMGIHHD